MLALGRPHEVRGELCDCVHTSPKAPCPAHCVCHCALGIANIAAWRTCTQAPAVPPSINQNHARRNVSAAVRRDLHRSMGYGNTSPAECVNEWLHPLHHRGPWGRHPPPHLVDTHIL